MNGIEINKDNLKSANWNDEYYKFCDFKDFSIEGGNIDSDFIGCSFENVEWYWGIFNVVNFIDCTFTNCTFKGTSFPDCKFVDCEINNCQFIKDNLDGNCTFNGAKSYNCKVENSVGFNVTNKNA